MTLEKIEKTLGIETTTEMTAMDETTLRKVVVEANQAMKDVKEELESNPKFQDLKASLKALSLGKRDVDKRQKARIEYALHLLTESGKQVQVDIREKA